MFDRIITKFKSITLGPPNELETALIGDLRREVLQLPTFPEEEVLSEAETLWLTYRKEIRKKLKQDDPRMFLTWRTILSTMFVNDPPYIAIELASLKSDPEWSTRWSLALRESPVGFTKNYPHYPTSSGNSIHHAYSLSQFEQNSGKRIEELSLIVEFGGGYGNMCRLVHNLGFNGRYVIFDLPEFSILQRFFLKLNNIHVLDDKQMTSGPGVVCVSGDADSISPMIGEKIDLFIANWSLSETPREFREQFLQRIPHAGNFLISYQDRFAEVDNTKFFLEWLKTRQDVEWNRWEINHLPGNYYLVGHGVS